MRIEWRSATELDTLHFEPDERQREYLRACLHPNVVPNVRARCRAAGVARQSYYTWSRKPGFLEWLREERRRATEADIHDVISAIAQRAKAGSAEHAKLFLRLAGMLCGGDFGPGDNRSETIEVNVLRPTPRQC